MRSVYIDTGAFIALVRRKDRDHDACRHHFLKLRKGGDTLFTSDAVVSETATRLRYDVGLQAALAFRRVLEGAGRHLKIRESDPKLRSAAFEVMSKFADLRLSYADCVGAAVAKEVRADAVFALDDDFRIIGFRVEPE